MKNQQHRKSCGMGMDFMVVKKEIKEELKTLDHKHGLDFRDQTIPSS
jgi:6-pyruvoyl-tetrahydropterin synthase